MSNYDVLGMRIGHSKLSPCDTSATMVIIMKANEVMIVKEIPSADILPPEH